MCMYLVLLLLLTVVSLLVFWCCNRLDTRRDIFMRMYGATAVAVAVFVVVTIIVHGELYLFIKCAIYNSVLLKCGIVRNGNILVEGNESAILRSASTAPIA